LSVSETNATVLGKLINDHFSKTICSLVHCSDNNSMAAQNQNTEFLIYRFINTFHYMYMIKENLFSSNNPKDDIMKWVNEGNILEVLKASE
jgi:hypothetical protein